MIDRKAIEISKVSVADASQIVELQNELLLNDRRDYKDGFLVSGFREEQYRDFAVRYEYFYKIVVHGELAGVLLAYESKHIEMDEKSNMLLKYALNKEFVLIKQVFVSPDFQRKGIASFLYDYLQDIIGGKKPLVAVVVLDPFNSGSSYFHQEKRFHEFLNFVPDADPDGVVRKRAAWIKPSAEAKGNIMFDLRLNNTIDGTDDLGDVMVSRMENLVQLYIHEDNLNWTKFSLQTTILFALFATFAYFYEKEILPDTFPVLVTVGIWGAIINILFILKIRSGIRYMNTYKGKIQDFDLLVSFHYPKLKKIFNRRVHSPEIDNLPFAIFYFSCRANQLGGGFSTTGMQSNALVHYILKQGRNGILAYSSSNSIASLFVLFVFRCFIFRFFLCQQNDVVHIFGHPLL